MQRTQSEMVFERLCASKNIDYLRIPESDSRTPDYELIVGEERIIVEVKEIAPNKEERESDRVLKLRGYGNVLSHTPGDRVRKKVAVCSAQIKARALGKHPSILVVFDRGRVCGHVDAYNIRVAMYGLEQVYFAVPPIGAGSPYATGMGYGPKRKMTREDNTSISAIGALCMSGPEEILLNVYHNRFAEVRLDPMLLGRYGIDHFELDAGAIGTTGNWRPCLSASCDSEAINPGHGG